MDGDQDLGTIPPMGKLIAVDMKQSPGKTNQLSIACFKGSGCGSVGRAVASDNKGPRFKSSHRQIFYIQHICTLSTVLRRQK